MHDRMESSLIAEIWQKSTNRILGILLFILQAEGCECKFRECLVQAIRHHESSGWFPAFTFRPGKQITLNLCLKITHMIHRINVMNIRCTCWCNSITGWSTSRAVEREEQEAERMEEENQEIPDYCIVAPSPMDLIPSSDRPLSIVHPSNWIA